MGDGRFQDIFKISRDFPVCFTLGWEGSLGAKRLEKFLIGQIGLATYKLQSSITTTATFTLALFSNYFFY